MPMIQVTIAGRSYRMACGDGDEPRLERLAASFDRRVEEMRSAFGEIGDMRLHVMAALTFVDELAETKKRLAAAEEELAALRGPADDEPSAGLEGQMADALNKTAERLERLAKTLSVPAPAGA